MHTVEGDGVCFLFCCRVCHGAVYFDGDAEAGVSEVFKEQKVFFAFPSVYVYCVFHLYFIISVFSSVMRSLANQEQCAFFGVFFRLHFASTGGDNVVVGARVG